MKGKDGTCSGDNRVEITAPDDSDPPGVDIGEPLASTGAQIPLIQVKKENGSDANSPTIQVKRESRSEPDSPTERVPPSPPPPPLRLIDSVWVVVGDDCLSSSFESDLKDACASRRWPFVPIALDTEGLVLHTSSAVAGLLRYWGDRSLRGMMRQPQDTNSWNQHLCRVL